MNDTSNLSDFGGRQNPFLKFDTVPKLREGNAVVLALPFEPGIARILAISDSPKKALKSQIHANHDVLQYLRVQGFEFRECGFPAFEGDILLVSIGEGFSFGFVDGFSLEEEAVVDVSAQIENAKEFGFLCFGGIESVF